MDIPAPGMKPGMQMLLPDMPRSRPAGPPCQGTECIGPGAGEPLDVLPESADHGLGNRGLPGGGIRQPDRDHVVKPSVPQERGVQGPDEVGGAVLFEVGGGCPIRRSPAMATTACCSVQAERTSDRL